MAHYTGSVHITLSNTEGHERELSEYVLGFIEENKDAWSEGCRNGLS